MILPLGKVDNISFYTNFVCQLAALVYQIGVYWNIDIRKQVIWRNMYRSLHFMTISDVNTLVFQYRHFILWYIKFLIRVKYLVAVYLRPHRRMHINGWWSFCESPWPQPISPAIWLLRAAQYLATANFLLGYITVPRFMKFEVLVSQIFEYL